MKRNTLAAGLTALLIYLSAHAIALGASLVSLFIYPIQIAMAIAISALILELSQKVLKNQLGHKFRNTAYLVSAFAFHGGINTGLILGYGVIVSAAASVLLANLTMLTTYIGGYKIWKLYTGGQENENC